MLKRIPGSIVWYHAGTTQDWYFNENPHRKAQWVTEHCIEKGIKPRYIIVTRYKPDMTYDITEELDLTVIDREKKIHEITWEFL